MIFLAAIPPNLPKVVLLGFVIIGLGLILRYFKQPYVIAYIVAGVLLGDYGFELITDKAVIQSLGEIGLILLLFFIGMEINLNDLLKNWRLSTIGTIVQIFASILIVCLIGWWIGWSWAEIIVLGFVISLSSSAVVIKLLQDSNEAQTATGKSVISILLMQDILIVPMLIATSYLGGEAPSTAEIVRQLIGGTLIIGIILWIVKKGSFSLPYNKEIEKDHELQVFLAFVTCFGFAVATAFFGLSAALGAFVGGIFVHAARSTKWFHDSLHAFRVVFVALFFMSVGLLIDIDFLINQWKIVALLVLSVYVSNHFINAAVLHYFGRIWRNSLYGGALLAQIGELSFVLSASAFGAGIITDYIYQLTVLTISLTLLISPFWIATTKSILNLFEKKH